MPFTPAGIASHRADFRFAEENGLTLVAGKENHLLAVGQFGANQFVLGIKIDGDDAVRARIGKFGERRLLDRAALGGHEHVAALFFEVGGSDKRGQISHLPAISPGLRWPCHALQPRLPEVHTLSTSRHALWK